MKFELSHGELKLLDAIDELAPKKEHNRFYFLSSRGKAEVECVVDYVISKAIEHRGAFVYDEKEALYTLSWLEFYEDEVLSVRINHVTWVVPTKKLLVTVLHQLTERYLTNTNSEE